MKQQSMEWKHTSSPGEKKFKSARTTGKVMMTVFLDKATLEKDTTMK